jgi:hypothetical protein
MADHLQMVRIAAQALIALVIDLLLAGYIPKEMGINDNVGGYRLSIQRHTSIATTTTLARVSTSPDMAWGVITPILHDNTFMDA